MYSFKKFYAMLINDPNLLGVIWLMESIRRRYSRLNFNTGEFGGLANSEKLSVLIEIINNDQDITRLHYMIPSGIGRIYQISGRPGIIGKDLRMEEKLYLCDLDISPDLPLSPSMPGYRGYCKKVPATVTLIKEFMPGLGYVELRNALLLSIRNTYHKYKTQNAYVIKKLKST